MAIFAGGLLGWLLGETPSTKYDIEAAQKQALKSIFGGYYDNPGMANQRMAHGHEPIDWAKILSDQFRAIALTRELTSYEKYLYNSALDGLHKAQLKE